MAFRFAIGVPTLLHLVLEALMLGNGDAFSAYLSRYTYVRLNSLPVDLKNMFN